MTNVHEFPLRFSGESGGTEFEFEINQPEHLPNYFQMVFLRKSSDEAFHH